jgi:vacuolar-type H+-ATPase subunit F/Vma7
MIDDANVEQSLAGPILFLGSQTEAAGFRLAGIATRVPPAGAEQAQFERARREAAVVLLGAACARAVAPSALEDALAARRPLVFVLPQPGGAAPTDPAARVRRLLGVEA